MLNLLGFCTLAAQKKRSMSRPSLSELCHIPSVVLVGVKYPFRGEQVTEKI